MVSLFVILDMCTSPLSPSLPPSLSFFLYVSFLWFLPTCLGCQVFPSIVSSSWMFTLELRHASVETTLLVCSPLHRPIARACVSPSVQKWEADTSCVWTAWNLPSSSSASLLCFSGEIHLEIVRTQSCTQLCNVHTCTYIKIFRQGGVFDPALWYLPTFSPPLTTS